MIFINAHVDDGSRIAKLMKACKGDKEAFKDFPRIWSRVKWFTESKKVVEEMSTLLEEYFGKDELNRRLDNARQESVNEILNELAMFLREKGVSTDNLIPMQQINGWIEQKRKEVNGRRS